MLTQYEFLVIETDGSLRWIQTNPFRLCEDFYNAIGCDWLENVYTVLDDIVLIVDEVGKVKSVPQDFNPLASRLYGGFLYGDYIAGPAVVAAIHLVDGESDWVPLNTSELVRLSVFLGIEIPPHSEE